MTTVSAPRARRSVQQRSLMNRAAAIKLAAAEYQRFNDVVVDLTADDWSGPTDCPAWDVRQLACHVLGMAELAAGQAEGDRQRQIAFAEGPTDGWDFTDALTRLQVAEREALSPEDVVAGLQDVGPRAAAGRKQVPPVALETPLPLQFEVNERLESWETGYLVDIILTRDVWMHRADLCRATGRPMTVTPEHDGVIVADVVAEWAHRHGESYRLTLTGPAGGRWAAGAGGESHELDAVEFCRILSGRGNADGLLATNVPF